MLSSPRAILGNILNVVTPNSRQLSSKLDGALTPTPKKSAARAQTPSGSRAERSSKAPPPPSPKVVEVVEAFGQEGVLLPARGPTPPLADIFGEMGVLEKARGHTPDQHKQEGRVETARLREAHAFVEAHNDATLLGDRVLCVPTGHEPPLDVNALVAHWNGKRYRLATAPAKRARNAPTPGRATVVRTSELAIDGGDSVKTAVARSGGKAVKKSKQLSAAPAPGDAWSLKDVLLIDRAVEAERAAAATKRLAWRKHVAQFMLRSKPARPLHVLRAQADVLAVEATAATALTEAATEAATLAAALAVTEVTTDVATNAATDAAAGAVASFSVVRLKMRGLSGAVEEPKTHSKAEVPAEVPSEAPSAAEPPTEDTVESPTATYERRLSELAPALIPATAPTEEDAVVAVGAAAAASSGLSVAAAKAMKVAELRAALEERGLTTDGLKPALLARLLAAIAPPTAGESTARVTSPNMTKDAPQTPAPASSRAQRAVHSSRLSAAAPSAAVSERRTSTRLARSAAA